MGTGIQDRFPLELLMISRRRSRVKVVQGQGEPETAIETPTARAAPGSSLGRCGWRAHRHARCSKPRSQTMEPPVSECQAAKRFRRPTRPSSASRCTWRSCQTRGDMPGALQQVRLRNGGLRLSAKPSAIVRLKGHRPGPRDLRHRRVKPGMKIRSVERLPAMAASFKRSTKGRRCRSEGVDKGVETSRQRDAVGLQAIGGIKSLTALPRWSRSKAPPAPQDRVGITDPMPATKGQPTAPSLEGDGPRKPGKS